MKIKTFGEAMDNRLGRWFGSLLWRSALLASSVLVSSVLVSSVLVIAGCAAEGDAPKSSHFEHDHETPPHWPDGLADLTAKLRQRLFATGGSSDDMTAKTIDEIKDLVSWTPEIAADTDLSEADWMPLYQASESLSGALSGARNQLTQDQKKQLESLCVLLDQAKSKLAQQTSPQVRDRKSVV